MSLDRKLWINQLLAWVQTEIEEQKGMLTALEEQERCMSGGTPQEAEAATQQLLDTMDSEGARRSRLTRILNRLANEMGLPASVLTLGSVTERLGGGPNAQEPRDAHAERLWELRGELRELAQEVSKRARVVAAVVRLQRSVVHDVLGALLTDEEGNPVQTEGTLIDASA